MTKGAVTRSRALDEQLAAITDHLARHDSILSKLEHYPDILESLHQSLTTQ